MTGYRVLDASYRTLCGVVRGLDDEVGWRAT